MNKTKQLENYQINIFNKFVDIQNWHGEEECVTIETLNADDANYLLNNMYRNRKPKATNLKVIRQNLLEKGWVFPSMIIISNEGLLLDGQHRMICLSECKNIEAKFVVAWNALPESMYHIDTGVSRSNNDIFNILGYEYPTFIGAIVNSIFFGNELKQKTTDKSVQGMLNKKDFPSHTTGYLAIPTTKIEKFYLEHRFVIDPIIKLYLTHKKNKISFPLFVLGALVRAYKGNYCSLDTIEHFLNLYFNSDTIGFSPNENAPVILRKRLTASVEKHSGGARKTKYQLTEKALKSFIEKKDLLDNQLAPLNVHVYELFPVSEFDFKVEK
jgi:hypothetical protein